MASGLIALLDDVVAIAKVAAASIDDTATVAAKAGAKAAGVVIDDAAVTPRYVTGFAASRELPIVAQIAKGSLRNKLLYLLPAGLVLTSFAPWSITPLLMGGGAYLCFEGAEKVYESLVPHETIHGPHDAEAAAVSPGHRSDESEGPDGDPVALEKTMVASAIRTDLILSGEIMAITLASVAAETFVAKVTVLTVVAVAITVGVYGAVALIVKADDAGLVLARSRFGILRPIGRALVAGMPGFLRLLAAVGTAAMLWVGGGILLHALETYGVVAPAHLIHEWAVRVGTVGGAVAEWTVSAAGAGVVGVAVGAVLVAAVAAFRRAARPRSQKR